jgi:stearoyl-CoA desaturase (delta-9 desaturase)
VLATIPIWLAIVIGLGVLMIAVHLTTIYLHRSVTHGAVRFAPWLESSMHWGQTLLTGIDPKQWSAVHLYHHLFPDRTGEPGDPHSPYLEGVWHIVFFNVYYYAKAARDPRVWAHPFVQERLARIRKRGIDRIGLWGPLGAWILGIVVFGWTAGLIMGLVYMVPYLLLNGAINGLAHYWGYKNFPSASGTNLRLLALFTGGEGLHNNHHGRFTSPFFAHRKVEWLAESGGLIIRLFCKLGWAEITAPAA